MSDLQHFRTKKNSYKKKINQATYKASLALQKYEGPSWASWAPLIYLDTKTFCCGSEVLWLPARAEKTAVASEHSEVVRDMSNYLNIGTGIGDVWLKD